MRVDIVKVEDGHRNEVRIVCPDDFKIEGCPDGETEIVCPSMGRAAELSEAIRFFIETRRSFAR